MTDDRAEFAANRDAGLVKRHEQRLARAQRQVVIEFDYRSDSGPRLVGPFPNRDAAQAWVTKQVDADVFREASWCAAPLAAPEETP